MNPRMIRTKNLDKVVRTSFALSFNMEELDLINKACRKSGKSRCKWAKDILMGECAIR